MQGYKTAGGAGIGLAYQTAKQNFMENGNNRVAFKGGSNYKLVKSLATSSIDSSSDAYKKEFLELVKKAEHLKATAKLELEEF